MFDRIRTFFKFNNSKIESKKFQDQMYESDI